MASPFESVGRGYYDGAGPDAQPAQPPRRRPQQPAPSMGPASVGAPKQFGQQMGSGSPAPQRPAYGPHTVTAASARPMMQPPRQRPPYGYPQRRMAPPPEPPPQFQPPSLAGRDLGRGPEMVEQQYPSLAGMDMGRGPEMVDDSGYQDDLQAERLRMMMAQRQRGGYY